MKRACTWLIAYVALLALVSMNPGPARASATLSWSPSEKSTITIPGSLRLVGVGVEGLAIQAADPALGERLDPDLLGQVRFRVNPRLELRELGPLKRLVFDVEADVTSSASPEGLSTALTWDPVWQERSLVPAPRLTRGSLTLSSDFGLILRTGLLRSSWGTGMVANGGEPGAAPEGASPFGVVNTGDRVARLQLLWMLGSRGDPTKGVPPRLLGLSVAADAVVDDDTSNWLDGDRTYQALAAVRGRYGRLHGGLYFVHRVQDHGTGGRTRVEVLDAYVHNTLVRGPIRAFFEAELAGVMGETTYVSSVSAPGPYEILSTGGVVRVGLSVGDLRAVVESGAASGDNNPFDNKLREFSFDRSFKVGLLMFSQGLRQITAVSAYNVADPGLRGAPPPGVDRIPSGGAVRGATYVNPRILWTPSPHFSLYVGYVHGESEEDYTDPFQSALAGGESRGPFGAPGQRNLGDEVDVGIATTFGDPEGVRFQGRLEAGWWRPGSVFLDPEGVAPGDIKGLTATVEATW